MEVLYRRGQATAAEILSDLADPPSYSAVRGMLRLLEEKGHVRHEWSGPRHLFRPVVDLATVQRSTARHVLRTFFHNSMESAVAAMLGAAERPPSAEELDRLARLLAEARSKGERR